MGGSTPSPIRRWRPALLILGGGVALHLVAVAALLWSMSEGMAEFDTGIPGSPLLGPVAMLLEIVWFPALQLLGSDLGFSSHAFLLLNTTAWVAFAYWVVHAVKRR